MARERHIAIILGAPGMGKTTLAKALRDALTQAGQRVAVLDPNGNIAGSADPDAIDVVEWMQERIDKRDADALFLDDADDYLPKYTKPGNPWRKVYLRNRHVAGGLDVIVTARRPQSLSPELWSGARYLFAFMMSPADVNGFERLRDFVPPFPVPQNPYEFVALDLWYGWIRAGRVDANGTFVQGEAVRIALGPKGFTIGQRT